MNFYRRLLPFCFTAVNLDLMFFFAAYSTRSLGRSSPNFATCSTVTQIYKIRSENWVASFRRNLAAPKHQNFGAISDNFATWSRISPERNNRQSKNGVENAQTPAQANLISVYFGPQTAKNMTGFLTHPTSGHQTGQFAMHLVQFALTPVDVLAA